MKNLFRFFLSLAVAGQLQAQVVEIPDSKFLNALIQAGVDKNGNGKIESGEAATCEELFLAYHSIKDLTGIEAFTHLKKLSVGNNQLTTLHLTHNRKLEMLECANNKLTKLDLSQNPILNQLICTRNLISKLDVRKNHYISDIQCNVNGMDSLLLQNNVYLFNLSANTNPGLVVDFSQCPNLRDLDLSNSKLTSIDLHANLDLRTLAIWQNNLTTLDLKRNTSISQLLCMQNLLTSTLDLSALLQLAYLSTGGNKLDAICLPSSKLTYSDTTFSFSKDKFTKWITCTQFVQFADDNFKRAVVSVADLDSDGEIDSLEANDVDQLIVTQQNIRSLGGIESFPNLSYLDFSHNNVWVYLPQLNPKLQFLACNYNHLTTLDIYQMPQLKYLYCEHNQIGIGMNFGGCPKLQEVHLAYNQISIIGRYAGLRLDHVSTFSCHHNPLENDIFQDFLQLMTHVEYVACGGSPLTSLDVSSLKKLKFLYCQKSQLAQLITDNPKLQRLDCSENQLTSLDISHDLSLVDFNAKENAPLSSICIDSAQLSLSGTWHKDVATQWNTCHASFRSEAEETAPVATSFSFFPNPAHSVVHVTSTSQDANISVFDLHGNELLRTKGEILDVSGLSPGVYFVRIEAGEEQKTQKLIVE